MKIKSVASATLLLGMISAFLLFYSTEKAPVFSAAPPALQIGVLALSESKPKLISKRAEELAVATQPEASPKTIGSKISVARDLSTKIFLDEDDQAQLKRIFLDPGVIKKIVSGLRAQSSFEKKNFKNRLALLDVVYEAFKSSDPAVSEVYTNLATQLLTDLPPSQIASRGDLKKQFVGDRIEMALMLAKANPAQATAVEKNALMQNPQSEMYFRRARIMASIYQVTL